MLVTMKNSMNEVTFKDYVETFVQNQDQPYTKFYTDAVGRHQE